MIPKNSNVKLNTKMVVDIPLSGTEFLTKIQIYSQMNKTFVTGTNITDKWQYIQLNFSKFKIRNHMGAGKIKIINLDTKL